MLRLMDIENLIPQVLNSKRLVYRYILKITTAFEREDLNKSEGCFEAIWVEIKIDKTKNIMWV